MKKLYLTLFVMLTGILCSVGANAQIVYSEPSPLQMSSQNVVIYYNAALGNGALKGSTASQTIYAHTGVITNKSTTDSDWQYATPKWGDNSSKYAMEFVGNNIWKLTIGNIAEYYGIKDPTVQVKKLAFVFRNANSSKQGKTAEGGDIFLDVSPDGFVMSLSSDLQGGVIMESQVINFSATTTEPATITIAINDNVVATKSATQSLSYAFNCNTPGDYRVVATAEANGQLLTEEMSFLYAGKGNEVPYPGGGKPKMGVVENADGTVTFCLCAPNKASVILVPSWNDFKVSADYVMNRTEYNGYLYYWVTVDYKFDPNKMYLYYYLVDNMSVGDPYAELVLDPYNDQWVDLSDFKGLPAYPSDKVKNVPLAVYYQNLNKYNWEVKNFVGVPAKDLVIYELLFRDFTGTEGQSRGDGTVKAAIEKIPYLKALGVNAVELLPINEFNGNISWGYNPNFYFAPDKAYGTPDDYKRFIDLCHKNGMAVILDIVFNQSDWMHPWYQMYDAKNNPFYNAVAPHAYSVLNDWRQGVDPLQEHFCDILRYWMEEYKVDGYRFDLVKGLGDNSSYANNGDAATNAFNQSRIDRMVAFQKIVEEVNPNAYFINENLAGEKEENAMAAYGQLNWSNVNEPACQYAMGYKSGSGMQGFYAPNYGRTWGSTVSYCESHDEQRVAYKQDQWGAAGVKGNLQNSMRRLGCNAAQMLLCPGAHMIWEFSELGNAESTKSQDGSNNTDPKKVLWSYYDVPDRHGLYDNYSELAWLRTSNPDLFDENASFSSLVRESNWEGGRFLYSSTSDKELVCVINPSITDKRTFVTNFRTKNSANYKIYSKSYQSNPSFSAEGGTVTVEPNCYVVIGSLSVSGVDNITVDNQESDATPVYYNLLGVKVDNPAAGLYIRVCGSDVRKVILK